MNERQELTARFEEHRGHLRAVAYRMLGSMSEAEDAVQEAWLRLNRSDSDDIENLGGWLTTVVSRLCLDTLRSRKSRHEASLGPDPIAIAKQRQGIDPETEVVDADLVGPALLVVLETLAPAERVAFVLHDVFDVPFEEIAPIVGRSETATRQLASRARRRVRGVDNVSDADLESRREVVDAFLLASREGDFDALLAVLAPDVVFRADPAAIRTAAANKWGGLASELSGARPVAEMFRGRARGARRALIDGSPGAVWAPGGVARSAFVFTVRDGKIAEIDLLMEPERLGAHDIAVVE